MNLVKTQIDHNDHHNVPLSNEKLQQEVSTVMVETEDEVRDAKRNANTVTMDIFIQSPVTTNTPKKKQTLQTRDEFLHTFWHKR